LPSRTTALAALMLSCAALSWAGNHIVARAIAGQVPPASVNLLRWLLVALIIGLVAHRQIARDWSTLTCHWKVMTALGISGGGLFSTLQYVGLQYTSVVNMGVLNSVAPALIVLASWLTFRDRIRPMQIVGIAMSLTGVLAMVSRLDPAALADLAFNRGDLIIIVNMALFALYSACLRLRPPVALSSFLFALSLPAALINLPWAYHEHVSGLRFEPSAMSFGAVAYAGLFTSIVAYICWSKGVESLGPGRAGVFLHLIPLFNTVLGTSLLGERPELHHAVGLGLILTGVALTARADPSRSSQQSQSVKAPMQS
jgi:drug/metabolite transporter (DMT)-like permease